MIVWARYGTCGTDATCGEYLDTIINDKLVSQQRWLFKILFSKPYTHVPCNSQ